MEDGMGETRKRRRFSLVRDSTRAFFREGRRTENYSLFDFLHGYVYGRWPYLYIGIGVGEHPLSKRLAPFWNFLGNLLSQNGRKESPPDAAGSGGDKGVSFADTYHGKVVPLQAATQLVTVQQDIRLPNLETIIPYARARNIVLKNPDHLVVLNCPCRSARENPCTPLDVCLIVGEPFAGFVLDHHPERARRITPDEAVEILKAEAERGHVSHAFFKDAMLERFYAICNCCSCCCGAMNAHRNGTPMLASSGYVSRVDEDLCISCGECEEYCQFGAIQVNGLTAVADETACMGCGVCVLHCEQDALRLEGDPARGDPLELVNLIEAAGSKAFPA